MDDQSQENLKELLARLFDDEQTENCIEDFSRAEQILQEYPAPKPDDMLIANIKAEMMMSLAGRKAKRFRRRLYEAAGIAAAIVILAIASVQWLEQTRVQPGNGIHTASLLPTVIWESDNIAADDADLAVFTAEIEQIEYEMHALQRGEQTVESDSTITELEMELEEINTDFWKG